MLKCNIDGACLGNPGMGAIAFCIKNEKRDLIFAKARGVGETTNIKAEALAIMDALTYCQIHNVEGVIIETGSLILTKMIKNQWKVPWELVENVEDIRYKLGTVQEKVIHTFKEGNTVVDALANEVIEEHSKNEYNRFTDLSAKVRKLINMDKSQIPNLRSRTHKIIIQ